jgi:xylono-1,5-lactonase
MAYSLELIASGFGLLEGPVWHPTLGLLVADVEHGGVRAYTKGKTPEVMVPHRRGIGGMALHADGGLIVGGKSIAYKRLAPEAAPTIVLIDNAVVPDIAGYNDLTTDAAGRIYAGSVGFVVSQGDNGRTGFLHLIDLDGSSRVVAKDLRLTNGLGFSPDGKRLYHSDSRANIIRVYDVAGDGSLSPPREFARISTGIPDGLAVAQDGRIWLALAYGSTVAVFAPDGREVERIPIPVPMVTSLCFGGPDLRDLYVVSGPKDAPPELKGCVYLTHVDTPGLPRPQARVRIPKAAA